MRRGRIALLGQLGRAGVDQSHKFASFVVIRKTLVHIATQPRTSWEVCSSLFRVCHVGGTQPWAIDELFVDRKGAESLQKQGTLCFLSKHSLAAENFEQLYIENFISSFGQPRPHMNNTIKIQETR